MTTYSLTGMSCMKCVAKVEDALKDFQAKVTLSPPQAEITDANDPGLDAIRAKLAGSKYGADTAVDTIPVPAVKGWLSTYRPLFLIIGYISVASIAGADGLHGWMLNFMAGFYLVFSFFKLLDLPGFASAYAGYDLLAMRSRGYGYIYPFIELSLGLCFLFNIYTTEALVFSVALMAFSSIGVILAVTNKKKIRCACLGSTLNLPMSTITIIEDLGMMLMGIFMLVS